MSFDGNRASLERTSAEEDEFLLESADKDGTFDGTKHKLTRPVKWIQRSHYWMALLACLILLSITLAIVDWASLWPRTSISSNPPTQFSGNDYILDPGWDFQAAPRRREYSWTISDVDLNPDGVFRPMTVINGQFPGPLIECNEGDTVVVHVKNQATNSTSIHWHGMYQNGTNWMDGAVGITQCPIAPGAKFTYEFKISGQSGTYFYHGHHGAQAADGLVGPLIIHSRDERSLQQLEYASDRVILVQDHYYDLSRELLMEYLKPDQENAEPIPAGALINGQNIRNCDTVPNRRCDNSTSTLQSISLEQNKNHRLRFINAGAFAEFQIQVDEHEFAVTEVDGTDVMPISYHRLNINPAQRYSIVFNTNITSQTAFWLRARMIIHCFAEHENVPELQPEVRAIIQYSTSKTEDIQHPISRDWPEVIEVQCRDMNTTELKPVIPITAPPSDVTINLRSNFEIGNWRLSRGFFNSSSWRGDSRSPSLHRFISGVASDNQTFLSTLDAPFGVNDKSFHKSTELIYQTSGIRTIDMIIENFDDGNHPMHLHGYKYFVLAQGKGYPPKNLMETLDISNPLRRDTASVEAFGWLALRFIADNAGMWAFHCHILWHTEAGLLMQFLTRADEVAKWQLPSGNSRLCELDGVERGDSPKDDIWFGNFGRD